MQQQLKTQLSRYGQQHLLAFWDRLSDSEREHLSGELAAVDYAAVERLVRAGAAHEDWRDLAARAEPPPAVRRGASCPPATRREAAEAGRQALADGQLGVILVAGGQGTRLGFPHPKGMVPIGPVSNASLFQIHFEKILAARRQYQTPIPLYLMTSPATHAETVQYLADHDRFGLPAEDLIVFCQGTMPAVDAATGRLLLAAPGALCLSPDGHGGVVAALRASGAVDDIRRRGLRHLFYFQVDNPLAPICTPELVGYHIQAGSDLSTLVVPKQTPKDRLGNVVAVSGKLRIIEYIDLPDEAAERRDGDGSLRFWAGSVGIHLFAAPFLEEMATRDAGLPFHVSRKRVPHIDQQGVQVEPDEPNALKFERFVFDLLPEARTAIVIEVNRQAAFAPLKNADEHDQDTRRTVRQQMMAQHRNWLQAAGAVVDPGVDVEISPLIATSAEELEQRIEPGLHVRKATYFHDCPKNGERGA